MSYTIVNQNAPHFLTFTAVGWIDIFNRKVYKDILIDSLSFCTKEKGLNIYAYVIMSNHMHIIAQTLSKSGLSSIIRDFKKFTSTQILSSIKSSGDKRKDWLLMVMKYHAKFNTNNAHYQLWIQSNKPTELHSPTWINQKVDYIHLNPVRAGIVRKPEDYVYSSAINYTGRRGVLNVSVLDYLNPTGFIDL